MGAEEIISAVADSGPLIHLAEIKAISLLQVFDALHIPAAVWVETVERGRISPGELTGLTAVRRHTLPQPEAVQFTQENNLLFVTRAIVELAIEQLRAHSRRE